MDHHLSGIEQSVYCPWHQLLTFVESWDSALWLSPAEEKVLLSKYVTSFVSLQCQKKSSSTCVLPQGHALRCSFCHVLNSL